MKKFLIIVEGEADKKFIKDYYHHLFKTSAPKNSIIHTGDLSGDTGGYKKLASEINLQQMRMNSDQGGVNLVIFDADSDYQVRWEELSSLKGQYGVEFELFLFPNNQDAGALEDLLENIINPNNRPIFDCWKNYEDELSKLEIPGRTPPPLTTPAKKTKIYGYLEALLLKHEKEKIKDKKRDYKNPLHWDLDAEYLEKLEEFIGGNLICE